ncbi:acetyl-CoA carboxylase carboxyl transferase subunit alpha, partial [bacterium]|nr:acetyl-CoA carboxylase carboxyl transferase subunit alpha [bacterium]
VTFIDSPGAFPGIGAEERGQHSVIAENLEFMAQLNVPIICVVTGEGGSGGALAIGVGNRVLMLENAYYAVCTPEACAAIILRDRTKASDVSGTMRITSQNLKELGLIDEIIPEPLGGAHRNHTVMGERVKAAILRHLSDYNEMEENELIQNRYDRFRDMGVFYEAKSQGISPVE